MLVGPKKTLFLDEISTGLDSSTTYLIVKCIRNTTKALQARCCHLSILNQLIRQNFILTTVTAASDPA